MNRLHPRRSSWARISGMILCSLLLSLPVRAQAPAQPAPAKEANGFSIGVRGDFTMVYGESREIVYNNYLGDNSKLSELFWDLNTIPMAGAVVSFQTPWNLSANVGFWSALDEGQGAMDDYDWMYGGSQDDWSDWSHSHVDLKEAPGLDINLSYAFWKNDCLKFDALLGYRRLHWDWEDYGGYFIYSVDSYRDTAGAFSQYGDITKDTVGIKYEQTFDIPYLGIAAQYKKGRCTFDAYALYSPLVSADDEDQHMFTGTTFTESFDNGDFWAVGLNGRHYFTDNFFVQLGIEYQEVLEIKGDMKIEGISVSDADAGIAHKSTTGTLALGYEFGL